MVRPPCVSGNSIAENKEKNKFTGKTAHGIIKKNKEVLRMVNILLDGIDLDSDYLREELGKYIKPNHRIVNVAFSFKDAKVKSAEDWERLYNPENGKYYKILAGSFSAFGIPMENMTFVNFFADTPESAADKIRNADIVYFPGGLPDRMMDRIREFKLEEVLHQHDGIIMGFSAGAMIQLEEFHVSPDDDYPEFCYADGIPWVKDFYLEVHYEGKEEQDQAIRRVLQERKRPVYATVSDGGAIIVDGGQVKLLGEVKRFDPER
jgi:peptidase E